MLRRVNRSLSFGDDAAAVFFCSSCPHQPFRSWPEPSRFVAVCALQEALSCPQDSFPRRLMESAIWARELKVDGVAFWRNPPTTFPPQRILMQVKGRASV
eukprot:scaffold145110_cov31-Prasinocladus_malaysianus.AAC.1